LPFASTQVVKTFTGSTLHESLIHYSVDKSNRVLASFFDLKPRHYHLTSRPYDSQLMS